MIHILDRILVLCMSCFIINQEVYNSKLAVFCMVAVFFAAIECLDSGDKIDISVYVIYLVLCIYFPEIILMLPIMTYDLIKKEKVISYIVCVLSLLLCSMNYGIQTSVYVGLMSVISFMLGYGADKCDKLAEKVRKTRDDSIEMNMFLTMKNKELMDTQDKEIYYAKLRERNRIAREIHDNVGHMLTRSILQMGALMTIHKEEPLHQELDSVKKTLDVAMNNVRESVHDLHDESIDLKQSLEDIVKELSNEYTMNFTYDVGENPPREYKYAIIGVVKEATANIIKHSINDCVDIVLREHPGMYQLTVHDYLSENGTPKSKKMKSGSSGIGMSNMEDRVAKFNGRISIYKDNGYKLFATFMK